MLLVVTVHLLPSLIYQLDFIIGVCVWGKSIVHVGFGTILGFRHPLGVLECTPSEEGGLLELIYSLIQLKI